MGTFEDKFQEIKAKNASFKKLKDELRSEEHDFPCIESEYDYYGMEFPRACRNYNILCACSVKECPHNKWNSQHINLLNRFWAARRARNQAILNLFRIKKK